MSTECPDAYQALVNKKIRFADIVAAACCGGLEETSTAEQLRNAKDYFTNHRLGDNPSASNILRSSEIASGCIYTFPVATLSTSRSGIESCALSEDFGTSTHLQRTTHLRNLGQLRHDRHEYPQGRSDQRIPMVG